MTPQRPTPHRSPTFRTLLVGALAVMGLVGCTDPPAVAPDAARKDAATEVGDGTVDVETPDVTLDRPDTSLDRAEAPRPDAAPDVRMDAAPPPDLEYVDLGPFVPDDVPAAYDVSLDRSWDVPRPDVNLQFLDVSALFPDVAPPDSPFPLCTVGAIEACACPDGRSGFQTCEYDFSYSLCACADPPPVVTTPRLIAPLSGMRVSSQRPTLRWQLPAGVARARVELCADRPCTRMLVQEEVTGSSWRSPTRLAPGLTFWRVRGLDAAGAVAWASATWLFQVRRRDTEVDTTLGRILDFNGDGYDDLPMRRRVEGDRLEGLVVDVFFGTPDGLTPEPLLTIQLPEAELASSLRIEKVSIGDADGDGLTDLVVAADPLRDSGLPWLLYVYRGDRLRPLGQRGWRMQLPRDYSVTTIYFPDLDGDGFQDPLVSGSVVFRGSESGPTSTPTYHVAGNNLLMQLPGFWWTPGVDFNQDGFPDSCRFGTEERETSTVAYGSGRVVFDQAPQPMGLPPSEPRRTHRNLATGDLNGDGYTDFVQTSGDSLSPEASDRHLLVVYGGVRQFARDTWRTLPLPFGHQGGAYPTGQMGDINGDGLLDLAVQIMDSDDRVTRIALYHGNRAGVALRPESILGDFRGTNTAFHVTLPGDFNGDGYDDMVLSEPGESGLSASRYNIMVFQGGEPRPAVPSRLFVRNQPVYLGPAASF